MLTAWIQWKRYLFVLCLTGIQFYSVSGLAQRWSDLYRMTVNQALEQSMKYYFFLRSEVLTELIEQAHHPFLFDPRLPFHCFYENEKNLMAISIDQSTEALHTP